MPPKNTVKRLGYHLPMRRRSRPGARIGQETGAEYLSLKLDDPSFTAPVYATLVQSDNGEHKLIWSR